jgi:hypothetical protein
LNGIFFEGSSGIGKSEMIGSFLKSTNAKIVNQDANTDANSLVCYKISAQVKPGFMMISSINSIGTKDRKIIDLPLQNRFTVQKMKTLSEYKKDDFLTDCKSLDSKNSRGGSGSI